VLFLTEVIMFHKLFCIFLLLFMTHLAFADNSSSAQDKIALDTEPNWETAEYTCPLSIKTADGEYNLRWYALYELLGKDGKKWSLLYPDSQQRKYVEFQFKNPDKRNIYMTCLYKEFYKEIILRVEGVTACGAGGNPWRAACWMVDPYAKKK
jgi:hypothetical protein